MNQWIDRIRNHIVWQTFDTFAKATKDAAKKEEARSDQATADGVSRLAAIAEIIKGRLEKVDPLHTFVSPFDGVNNAFQVALVEVQAFISDGAAEHIIQANVLVDGALSHFGGFYVPQSKGDLEAISKLSIEYRQSTERFLTNLTKLVKEREEALQELREKIAKIDSLAESEIGRIKACVESESKKTISEIDRLAKLLTDLGARIDAEQHKLGAISIDQQTQFTAAQDSRAREYADAQTARQEKYASTMADQQSQFVATQSERQEKTTAVSADQQTQFVAAQSDRQEKYAALIADHTQKLTEQNDQFSRTREETIKKHDTLVSELDKKYQEAAQATLKKIEAHKKQIEGLVGVIGNLGVTSGYLTAANYARKSLWFWQGITVIALGGLIAVAARAFATESAATFSWEVFAGRVLLAITVGVLAAYAGSQADKLLRSEKRNRQLALELEAIGPYLAPLPPEMQDKFRIELGERTFGHGDGPAASASDKSPATVVDVIDGVVRSKELKELIVDAVKAAGKQPT